MNSKQNKMCIFPHISGQVDVFLSFILAISSIFIWICSQVAVGNCSIAEHRRYGEFLMIKLTILKISRYQL